MYEADGKHGIHLWKAATKLAAGRMMNGRPLYTGPIRLRILWFFQRPGRLLKQKYAGQHLLYDGAKDIDNLEKALLDSINQVVWVDDRQVSNVTKVAMWAGPYDPPGCYLWISRDCLESWVVSRMAPLPPVLPSASARPRARRAPRSR